MGLDSIVFKDKKMSDLLEEIYNNQKKKDKQINSLINQLKDHVNDLGDATVVVPMIKDYLEVAVKNDDAIVKMVTIVQRMLNSQPGTKEFDMNFDELQKLIHDDEPKKK